jgi:hypothetical protein
MAEMTPSFLDLFPEDMLLSDKLSVVATKRVNTTREKRKVIYPIKESIRKK